MDQRGSGIGRMKAAMLNHGLGPPTYDEPEGYFRVTLRGPSDNLDKLRVPSDTSASIAPAIMDQLSERQQRIVEEAVLSGKVTTGWVVKSLKVSKPTAFRDLDHLYSLEVLERKGKGRGVHYVPWHLG